MLSCACTCIAAVGVTQPVVRPESVYASVFDAAAWPRFSVCCLLHCGLPPWVLPVVVSLCCCPAGFKALCEAFTSVTGDCKPFSITGSLPCIRDLQEAGFDVQTLGFGKLAAYHSNNGELTLTDRCGPCTRVQHDSCCPAVCGRCDVWPSVRPVFSVSSLTRAGSSVDIAVPLVCQVTYARAAFAALCWLQSTASCQTLSRASKCCACCWTSTTSEVQQCSSSSFVCGGCGHK